MVPGFYAARILRNLEGHDLLERFMVIGTPDTCICQIRRLQDAMRIDHFNCSFWFGDLEQPQILRPMRLFAEEVMPVFQ